MDDSKSSDSIEVGQKAVEAASSVAGLHFNHAVPGSYDSAADGEQVPPQKAHPPGADDVLSILPRI